MPRCPNPRCQANYPPGTDQCTNPFCQCLLPEAIVAGRYRIETLIGMGGMGAVYRTSDTFELEQVALKVLTLASGNTMDKETAVERFRREARYARQLKHPNIVPVLNFGQDGKLLYLAMPLVTGGTVKSLLQGESPLPIPQAQRYLNDLGEAIDAIHQHPQQIVHRDIKPSNLLIHQKDGRLVVTDFGIARAMQQEKALTQRGWSLGTQHYIAPEQVIGKAEPASDIYAMGGRPITSLALVCFPEKGDLEVLERILAGGLSKMMEASCTIIGGHSIRDEETKFGYSVTGLIDPNRVFTNGGAKPGDRLLFTKALGTGVISTAIKKGTAKQSWINAATASMTTLNKIGRAHV